MKEIQINKNHINRINFLFKNNNLFDKNKHSSLYYFLTCNSSIAIYNDLILIKFSDLYIVIKEVGYKKYNIYKGRTNFLRRIDVYKSDKQFFEQSVIIVKNNVKSAEHNLTVTFEYYLDFVYNIIFKKYTEVYLKNNLNKLKNVFLNKDFYLINSFLNKENKLIFNINDNGRVRNISYKKLSIEQINLICEKINSLKDKNKIKKELLDEISFSKYNRNFLHVVNELSFKHVLNAIYIAMDKYGDKKLQHAFENDEYEKYIPIENNKKAMELPPLAKKTIYDFERKY